MSVCVTVYLCMPAYRYFYLYLSVYLPACLFICPLICLMFTALFPSLPFLSSDPPSAHITSSQLNSPPHTLMFSHGDEDTPSFICSADGNPPPTVLWQVQKDTHLHLFFSLIQLFFHFLHLFILHSLFLFFYLIYPFFVFYVLFLFT